MKYTASSKQAVEKKRKECTAGDDPLRLRIFFKIEALQLTFGRRHALDRIDDKEQWERMKIANKRTLETADVDIAGRDPLLQAGALQSAIFNSANFSSIATDAKGVIQIFNVGAERMLGYGRRRMNKITPADISDPQEVILRAKELSVELAPRSRRGSRLWCLRLRAGSKTFTS